jgi:hypothetical protein
MDQLDPGQPAEQPVPAGSDQIIKELSLPLYEAKGWMRLLGVLSIISGILTIFSIWGIIICWIPIWVGILLMRAASAVEHARHSNDRMQLVKCFCQLRTYFTLQGVFSLIGIIVAIFALIIAGGAMVGALGELGDVW